MLDDMFKQLGGIILSRLKLLLPFIVGIALFVPLKTSLASYSDVIQGSWYADHVETLTEKGLINGYQDGRFGTNDSIIRENAARLLGRWFVTENFYIPEDSLMVNRFYDIPFTKDKELVQLTALLAEEGIFLGTEGKFLVNANLTRGQMALVLTRSIKLIYDENIVALYKKDNFKTSITDINVKSIEMQEAITALEYIKLTNNKQFKPDEKITRAEFATFLGRTMQYFKKEPVAEHSVDVSQNDASNNSNESSDRIEQNYLDDGHELINTEENIVQDDSANLNENVEADQPLQLNVQQYNHFLVKKGMPLYSSQNLKRQVALMERDEVFPVVTLENMDAQYFEIGNERYYVHQNDIQLKNEGEIPISTPPNELGYVRLKAPYQLFADAALTSSVLIGNYETRFKVQKINGSIAEIESNGKTYFIKMNDRVLHRGLPYKLLASHPLLSYQLNYNAKGTLGKGVTFLSNFSSSTLTYFNDFIDTYAVRNTNIIEVDELISFTHVPNYSNVHITFKSNVELYTIENEYIGTINSGQTAVLTGTHGEYGYTTYGGITVRFPLSTIYHTNLINGFNVIPYELMVQQLRKINQVYPSFTKLEVIGYTVEGRAIYALKVGTGKREIVMDAALHAREYLTTNVLMEMIDEYTHAYARNSFFEGYAVKQLLDKTSIWFIPMVNADGVTLVQQGVKSTPYGNLVTNLNGSTNVSRWKANIRGVDLNRNFDGNWVEAVTESAPSWRNFKGYTVFSEPESKAIRDFFVKRDFKAYISYHSSGNLLYYWHWQSQANQIRDYAFAKKISNTTGYYIMPAQNKIGSGSSADWFIKTYKRPGITMEISPYVGDTIVPLSYFADIWKRNKTIGLLSAKESENF